MRTQRAAISLVAAAVLMMAPTVAQAQYELWETDRSYAEIGSNVQFFGAYMDLRNLDEFRELEPVYPGIGEMPSGGRLGGGVGRLEWYLELGERVDVNLHNRFVWERSELDFGFESEDLALPGLEVSPGADRRVDTRYDLVEGDDFRLTHDIDRLVAGVYFDAFDLYLGRQAIRWGVSDIFPVADRFAPLSPFELDTVQRRGIDAGRMVALLLPELELDVVVADRGEDEPVSFGAKTEYTGVDFTAYAGGGRFWERVSAMGGFSWLTEDWKLFTEAEVLWNLDDDQWDRPRVTTGIQRVAMEYQVGVEYHYNGFGVEFRDDYVDALGADEMARGETYFMGRHYLGAQGMYMIEPEFRLGGGVIMNVLDPSVVVFPSARYELDDQISVGAGAYVGIGEEPEVDMGALAPDGDEEDLLTFPSEYGLTSNLYFLEATVYF